MPQLDILMFQNVTKYLTKILTGNSAIFEYNYIQKRHMHRVFRKMADTGVHNTSLPSTTVTVPTRGFAPKIVANPNNRAETWEKNYPEIPKENQESVDNLKMALKMANNHQMVGYDKADGTFAIFGNRTHSNNVSNKPTTFVSKGTFVNAFDKEKIVDKAIIKITHVIAEDGSVEELRLRALNNINKDNGKI